MHLKCVYCTYTRRSGYILRKKRERRRRILASAIGGEVERERATPPTHKERCKLIKHADFVEHIYMVFVSDVIHWRKGRKETSGSDQPAHTHTHTHIHTPVLFLAAMLHANGRTLPHRSDRYAPYTIFHRTGPILRQFSCMSCLFHSEVFLGHSSHTRISKSHGPGTGDTFKFNFVLFWIYLSALPRA